MINIDFTKLTPQQLRVFEQVAIGYPYGHPVRTLESLEKKGYLRSHLEQLRGYPPVAVTRYSVPIPVHIAWCRWCAEVIEKESEEVE